MRNYIHITINLTTNVRKGNKNNKLNELKQFMDIAKKNLKSQKAHIRQSIFLNHVYAIQQQITQNSLMMNQHMNWSSYFSVLSQCDTDNNSIGKQGVKIISLGKLTKLRILNLDSNNIDSKALRYLGNCQWSHLSTLTLKDNYMGDSGTKQLSKLKFPQLKNLFIGGNKITCEGSKNLVGSNFAKLKFLKIKDNSLGWWGCIELSLGNWHHLSRIYLSTFMHQKGGNNLKPAIRYKLVQTMPQNWDIQLL